MRGQVLGRPAPASELGKLMLSDSKPTDAASGVVAPLDRDSTVWIAGHTGLAGSAIWRSMERQGFTKLIGKRSGELDLTDRAAVLDFVSLTRPSVVVMAAAYVGGIVANNSYPADFISRNLQMQTNVFDAAAACGVPRLLFFGSSCIYPKLCDQPIREQYLLTGKVEETNEAYALAKLAGLAYVRAVRRQFGLPWICAMPTNLYGPGDNFTDAGSHVLSALIRRVDDAMATGAGTITNWGTGSPRREFLYIDDLAAAAIHLLEHYNAPDPINIGTGEDHSIKELSEIIADAMGYSGEILWDSSKPDGTPRKLLDVSALTALGWRSSTDLETGVLRTVDWYRKATGHGLAAPVESGVTA